MATNTFVDIQASPSDRLASRIAQLLGPDYVTFWGSTTTTTANQELLIEGRAGYRLQMPTGCQLRIEVFAFGRRMDTDVPAPAAPETAIFYPQSTAAGVITLGSAVAGGTLSVYSLAAATDSVSGKQYIQVRCTPANAVLTHHQVAVHIHSLANPPAWMPTGVFSGVRS